MGVTDAWEEGAKLVEVGLTEVGFVVVILDCA